MFHAANPLPDSLADTACRRQINLSVDSLTNVRSLIGCAECYDVCYLPFHLADNDGPTGQGTACGITSDRLASSRSTAIVTCPMCLRSERFRDIKAGKFASESVNEWEGDQS